MTDGKYDVGDRVKLSCTIRDEAGEVVDPSQLLFELKEPDGVVTAYMLTDTEIVHEGTGVFSVYWDVAAAGVHHWRYTASGNVGVAEEAEFVVRTSKI